MLAGGRALAEDASLLLLGRLRPRHLADLAVRRDDLRLRGHELLADHLRDDTAGRRRLLVEGRGDALGAVHRDAASAGAAAGAAPAAEGRVRAVMALGKRHDSPGVVGGRAGRTAVDAVARNEPC